MNRAFHAACALLLVMLLVIVGRGSAKMTCEIATSCQAGYVDVFHLSSSANAHGELSSQSSYANRVCCTENNYGTLGTSCTGNYIPVINLSKVTNAHAERWSQGRYSNGACLNSTTNVTVDYQGSCSPDGACLASMSGTINAHLGNCTAYSTRVCGFTQNITITTKEGNGTMIGTAGFGGASITLNFFDNVQRTFPNNVSGRVWVEKSPGTWDGGHNCTTNSQGNCSIEFIPTCDYTNGRHLFRGGPFQDDIYDDRNSTEGEVTIDISAFCFDRVTLSLEFNLSGNSGDVATVGTDKGTGFYEQYDLPNPYVCVHDTSVTNTPTFGIIFAGTSLSYINLSTGDSFVMKMSQRLSGNKFIIPVTRDGCSVVADNIAEIKAHGFMPHAFVSFVNAFKNVIEITIVYHEVDIVGSFSKTGSFTVNLDRIEANVTRINITEA
ncbi:MAG: hypothetical protein HYY37_03865 [Candidatus Aenigmarchaeota archaeon]|nr:hypothetical protein [Candidatus Aenigmarchaeota archaeon]